MSRLRRFGKSYAAQMLCAYYDKSCDSSVLFDDLEIAVNENMNRMYTRYLNSYDVIYLDMTGILGAARKSGIVPFIIRDVTVELTTEYPGLKSQEAFFRTLADAVVLAGNKFIMIIIYPERAEVNGSFFALHLEGRL